MIFNKLEIEKGYYGSDKGKVKGSIRLRSDDGTSIIYLNLNDAHIKSIFDMIEPELSEVLKESIQALRDEVNGSKEERR